MRRSTVALTLCTLAGPAAAQTPMAGRLAAILDSAVPAALIQLGEPGIVVTLVDQCRPAWVRAWGVADSATRAPLSDSTLFNVGSISKTFTAWTVMSLVADGRLALDTPADRYLRAWRLPARPGNEPAPTIRQLLSHTAGLTQSSLSGVDHGRPVPSLADDLSGRGATPGAIEFATAPGTAFAYSGGGYSVLQLIVEDVTGRPFAEVARERVLGPLGFADGGLVWRDGTVAKLATPYHDGRAYAHRRFPSVGAAGLLASGRDMQRFLLANCVGADGRAGGGILAATVLDTMRIAQAPATRYGLGYEVTPPLGSYAIAGHSGSNFGWKADMLIIPAAGIGFVMMSNSDAGAVRRVVMRTVQQAVSERLMRR